MKKFGLVAVVGLGLLGAGFFISSNTGANTSQPVQTKEVYEYKENKIENVENNIYSSDFIFNSDYNNSLYMGNERVYDVYFINWQDYASFNEDTYQYYINKFNEMRNFFLLESRGNFSVNFNFYVYNSSFNIDFMDNTNYNNENQLRNDAMQNATLISYYGNALSTLLVGSYPEMMVGGSAHVWGDGTNLALVPSDCRYYSWAHELYHTLGLPDLYSNKKNMSNLIKHDMMSVGIYDTTQHPVANAFDKKSLGWLDEGVYDDGVVDAIEDISKTGHYTLYAPSNQTNTIAYKLPYNNDEKQSFFLETRDVNGNLSLIVNRYNTFYKGSYDATSLNTARAATLFEISENNNFNIVNEIYDAQNKKLNIIVKDVEFFADRVEFDVMFDAKNCYFDAVLDVSAPDNCEFGSVNIYINGNYARIINKPGKYEIKVLTKTTIKLEGENFQPFEYYIESDFANRENYVIKVQLQPKMQSVATQQEVESASSQQYLCKFLVEQKPYNISTNGSVFIYCGSEANLISLYVNNVQVYAGNDIANQTFNIKNNAEITIKKDMMIAKKYKLIDGKLVDLTSNKKSYPTTKNNIYSFGIELEYEKMYAYNINISTENNSNKKLDVTYVSGYNKTKQKWDKLTFIGTNNIENCITAVLPSEYSYIHVCYTNYWDEGEFYIELQLGVYNYFYTINQNFVQDALDGFFGLFG